MALAADPAVGREHQHAKEEQVPVGKAAAVSLTQLEQLAIQGNPTLAQAAAQVEAARGRAMQSGLYPNPTVGYIGEQIGSAGTAGEQGAFIDQLIITGGKLRLSRAKFSQEVSQAEALALAQQYRVLNGVRTRFYELLAQQRLLKVREDLLKIAEDAVTTTEELLNVGQANRPDLLQARIEVRQQRIGLANARALYQAAWQELAALIGQPCLALGSLQGNLEEGCPLDEFDATLVHLLEASPEMLFAHAEITRSQFGLQREKVESIPNVRLRGGSQYNFETNSTQALAEVGFSLPIFDRNQGNIQAAQAQLMRAQEEIRRVELSLRQRLTRAYARYRTALAATEEYRNDVLPDAKEAFDLYLDSFRKRRAAYPQVLVAQRSYFQFNLDYVEALEELRRTEVAIRGLLLVDGLEEPQGPPSAEDVRFQRPGADEIEPNGRRGRGVEGRIGNRPGD